MPVDEKTLEALDLNRLRLPASPQVTRLEAEHYTDSSGEPALRILVVLDESTDIDHLSGADVGELKFAIRESLREHGITGFPYIFLAKDSELKEPDEEE
jgi:hypothetical protein